MVGAVPWPAGAVMLDAMLSWMYRIVESRVQTFKNEPARPRYHGRIAQQHTGRSKLALAVPRSLV